MTKKQAHICNVLLQGIPYKNKYWRGTKFGELTNHHTITKFQSRQYSVSIVALVAF